MGNQPTTTTTETKKNSSTPPIDVLSDKYQTSRAKQTSDGLQATIHAAKLVHKHCIHLQTRIGGVDYILKLPKTHVGSYNKQQEKWSVYQSIIDAPDIDVQREANRQQFNITLADFINKEINIEFTNDSNTSCRISNTPVSIDIEPYETDTDDTTTWTTTEDNPTTTLTHLSLLAEYFSQPTPITCHVETNTDKTTENTLVVDLITSTGGLTLHKSFPFDESNGDLPAANTKTFIEAVGEGSVKELDSPNAVHLHPESIIHQISSAYIDCETLGTDSQTGDWHVLTEEQEKHRTNTRNADNLIGLGEWLSETSFGVYPTGLLMLLAVLFDWASPEPGSIIVYKTLIVFSFIIMATHLIATLAIHKHVKRKYRYAIINWL